MNANGSKVYTIDGTNLTSKTVTIDGPSDKGDYTIHAAADNTRPLKRTGKDAFVVVPYTIN